MTNQPSYPTNFDGVYDSATATFLESIFARWQHALGSIKHSYAITADTWIDEILATVSQEQINDALHNFVVKNVSFLLKLELELFDEHLRLHCTANLLGMHLSVASNFKLIQIRLDRHVQKLVLQQISPTDVLSLHTKAWYKAPVITFAINAYRALLKKDPLPFLLSLSPKLRGLPFVEYKGNIIYLEIGRWLPDDIKAHLKKAQINGGDTQKEQLVLRVQPNFGDILSFGDPNADIITEKDNPQNKSNG